MFASCYKLTKYIQQDSINYICFICGNICKQEAKPGLRLLEQVLTCSTSGKKIGENVDSLATSLLHSATDARNCMHGGSLLVLWSILELLNCRRLQDKLLRLASASLSMLCTYTCLCIFYKRIDKISNIYRCEQHGQSINMINALVCKSWRRNRLSWSSDKEEKSFALYGLNARTFMVDSLVPNVPRDDFTPAN